MDEDCPLIIFMISGKRKSGKDFVSDLLKEKFGDESVLIRIAGPIKHSYALANGLDYSRMLTAEDYKEKYRVQMVKYQTEKMAEDGAFFCKKALSFYEANKFPVWIVSDLRRPEELNFFRLKYQDKMVLVRVEASEEVRSSRGFEFCPGIDDKPTECALDDYSLWHLRLDNNGERDPSSLLEEIMTVCNQYAFINNVKL